MTRTSILKGAVLTTSMRWIDRMIGLISTLILARLLVPEDFGIIAAASLVIGLLDVLLDLGVHVALIQNPKATQDHYDTAWSLRLLQNGLALIIIIVAAPLVATYFGDERITPVLQWMSLGLLLAGLENIGIIRFQKEMQFGLDFRFTFLKRLSGFIVTVIAAWLLQSYWAMVIGALAGRGIGVLLSYRMAPMRPRFTLVQIKDIFRVSQWMLVRNIGSYLNGNLHRILVGRRTDTATLGGYTLADEISAMPSTELVAPVNRVLFPAFVRASQDFSELKRLFLLAQGVQTLVGVPASIGLALVAHEAILLLLGEKWLLAVPFIQLLALANVVHAITSSGTYAIITIGHIREVAWLEWVQVAIFGLGAFLAIPQSAAIDLAWLRILTVAIGLFLALWILLRAMPNLRVHDIARTISRPLLGALVMSIVIIYGINGLEISALTALILKITVGLIAYPTAVLGLWWMSGRPAGAEQYLLEKLIAAKKRVANKN